MEEPSPLLLPRSNLNQISPNNTGMSGETYHSQRSGSDNNEPPFNPLAPIREELSLDQEATKYTTSRAQTAVKLLCLDAGGHRGLAQLLTLQTILQRFVRGKMRMPKPCEIFDLIAGTGSGGLIAIMLGSLRMDIRECIEEYCIIMRRLYNTKSFFELKNSYQGNEAPTFNANEFKLAIMDLIEKRARQQLAAGSQMLDARNPPSQRERRFVQVYPPHKVFVCSKTIDGLTAKRIRSYVVPNREIIACTIWEAARATMAGPGVLEPIQFRMSPENYFTDGGAWTHNPIYEIVDEARLLFPEKEIACVLSIGTGVSTFDVAPFELEDLSRACARIATDCAVSASFFASQHQSLRHAYFRFDVGRELTDVTMLEWSDKGRKSISDHVGHYMNQPEIRDQMKRLVNVLRTFEVRCLWADTFHRMPDQRNDDCNLIETPGKWRQNQHVTVGGAYWAWKGPKVSEIRSVLGDLPEGCYQVTWYLGHVQRGEVFHPDEASEQGEYALSNITCTAGEVQEAEEFRELEAGNKWFHNGKSVLKAHFPMNLHNDVLEGFELQSGVRMYKLVAPEPVILSQGGVFGCTVKRSSVENTGSGGDELVLVFGCKLTPITHKMAWELMRVSLPKISGSGEKKDYAARHSSEF